MKKAMSLALAVLVALAVTSTRAEDAKVTRTCPKCKTELASTKVPAYGKPQAGMIEMKFYSHQCADCQWRVVKEKDSKDLKRVHICSVCGYESDHCFPVKGEEGKAEKAKK